MSGVDERVETVRVVLERAADMVEGTELMTGAQRLVIDDELESAYIALSALAAAVAGLEQRADEAEKALRHYANLDPDEVPYRWTINDDPDIGHVARAYFAAAAVVSAEPTEETT